jgi:glycine C-acetyltransferase
MMGDAAVAAAFAERLWARGVYAVSFSFPVVPRGQARIRTQLSAAHSFDDVDFAVAQFTTVRDELAA